jgi:hypothetical protein
MVRTNGKKTSMHANYDFIFKGLLRYIFKRTILITKYTAIVYTDITGTLHATDGKKCPPWGIQ